MRLHHLRSGRGSTSGAQEDTLGLLGSKEGAKGNRTAQVSPRAASLPKGQEFTPGGSSSCSPRAAKETDQIQGS